ncbi:MAG TPA: hypothetical protein VG273_11770 [Bryobacteraceae bacterium]|jgi:hypothetical protein|nr:hypothetical protein [Bryobacteraceae bacterium]
MEALAVTARTFRVRPSELLAIEDRMLALNLDLAAMAVINRLEREARENRE